LRALASVAGLAPARFCLKGRACGLLCIHGLLAQGHPWSPGPVSRRRLPGFSGALISLSYPGSCVRRSLVVRRGNAPRSLAYRASALLLSYQTKDWADSNASSGLIALAKEQLALVTEYRFHGIYMVDGLGLAEGVGNAPTPGLNRSCFRDRRSQLVSACLP